MWENERKCEEYQWKTKKYESEYCKFKKINQFVNMWLVKNYQKLYEIKELYFIFCI